MPRPQWTAGVNFGPFRRIQEGLALAAWGLVPGGLGALDLRQPLIEAAGQLVPAHSHAVGGVRAPVHVQLLEDAVDVILHGVDLDAEVTRDLLVGAALPDQGNDLELARRQARLAGSGAA